MHLYRSVQLACDADMSCSEGVRSQDVDESDGTCSGDQDALAGGDARPLTGSDTYRQRLQQGPFLKGHIFGKFEAEIGRMVEESGQGAVVRRRGRKGHVRAKVVAAFLAILANSARNSALDRDSVADDQVADAVANGDHRGRRLVTQDHR